MSGQLGYRTTTGRYTPLYINIEFILAGTPIPSVSQWGLIAIAEIVRALLV